MTEADKFFEETAMKVEEPVLAQASNNLDYTVYGSDIELSDDEEFFDEVYADEIPLFGPKTQAEAISRLRKAEKQLAEGNWHTLEEVVSMVRSSIRK